jgi:ribA/ribD-fused uncharacterized protein
MEFDPAALALIRESPDYITEIARCRQAAITAVQSRPPKRIDGSVIEFYGKERDGNNDIYGKWFSNCVPATCVIDGVTYPSSEHYYQCAKFHIVEDLHIQKWCADQNITFNVQNANNEAIRDQMMTMSPVNVARFGQTIRTAPIRSDWKSVKNNVMWRALIAKFTQNPEFAAQLVATGNKILIERAPTDRIWAINNNGIGENMLGCMLMMLRELIDL